MKGGTLSANRAERRRFDESGIADLLRDRTRLLHARAERSGIIGDLLRGRVSAQGYVLFLRNLLPVYRELEAALERHRRTRGIGRLFDPAIVRARALESDLRAIAGGDWERSLPLLPAGKRYRQRVVAAAGGTGVGLISHCYVRYLGDLNGGQVMQRLLERSLGLRPSELAFYRFPMIQDLGLFKAQYRRSVDLAGRETGDRKRILDEGQAAFELNIRLSEAAGEADCTGPRARAGA